MKIKQLSLLGVLVAAACNGQLTVGDHPPGGGGSAGSGAAGGSGGRNNGVAGSATAGLNGVAGEHRTDTGGQNGIAGSWNGAAGETGVAGNNWNGAGGETGVAGTWNGTAGVGGYINSSGWRGVLGAPCIPGGLVTEADGTPAKTQIKDLPHCADGLSCNADNKCMPTPDCPQAGELCVVRRAALGAGSGGAGGGPATVPGWGGETGSWGGSSSYGGNGSVVHYAQPNSGVTAMTANESRVYWVEYGTRDALGNYQHDGALLAHSPEDGTTSVIASGMDGPIGVELTTTHAYIYVDGARPNGTPARTQLLRVPLAGGTAELVQEGGLPASFAAAGSRPFWTTESNHPSPKIYSLTSDSNPVPTEFLAGYSYGLAVDATDLYYANGSGGLMRAPLTGAAPVAVALSVGDFVLRDDAIFALERISGAGQMLSRVPKSGGEYVRVRALGAGDPMRLRSVGDRYFFEAVALTQQGNGWPCCERQVISASFVDSAPPVRLLHRLARPSSVDHLWAATAGALYWSEGLTVYKQPLPTP